MSVRCILALSLAVLLAPAALSQPAPAPAATPILATINDFNVTPAYLDYVIRNHFARAIMDSVVRSRVIADEAAKQGLRLSHDQVTERLEAEQAKFPGEDAFLAHIQQQGFTLKGYREHLQTEMLLEALLANASGVTDDAIEDYYDEHKAEYGTETQLHVMHIVTNSADDAVVAYRALLDGTPFAVAARRFAAEDAPAKDGDLGWVSAKTIPAPDLWQFAEALEEGQMTEPFELNGRFHIVKVEARRMGAAVELAAVKEQIRAALQAAGTAVDPEAYVASLIAKARIDIAWSPVAYLDKEYAELGSVRVFLDGRKLSLIAPAFLTSGGVPMLPAKSVLQAIGATLNWRPVPKILEVKLGETALSISVGEKTFTANEEFKPLDAPAVIKDGTTFIPASSVLGALGYAVSWNPTTKALSVTKAQ